MSKRLAVLFIFMLVCLVGCNHGKISQGDSGTKGETSPLIDFAAPAIPGAPEDVGGGGNAGLVLDNKGGPGIDGIICDENKDKTPPPDINIVPECASFLSEGSDVVIVGDMTRLANMKKINISNPAQLGIDPFNLVGTPSRGDVNSVCISCLVDAKLPRDPNWSYEKCKEFVAVYSFSGESKVIDESKADSEGFVAFTDKWVAKKEKNFVLIGDKDSVKKTIERISAKTDFYPKKFAIFAPATMMNFVTESAINAGYNGHIVEFLKLMPPTFNMNGMKGNSLGLAIDFGDMFKIGAIKVDAEKADMIKAASVFEATYDEINLLNDSNTPPSPGTLKFKGSIDKATQGQEPPDCSKTDPGDYHDDTKDIQKITEPTYELKKSDNKSIFQKDNDLLPSQAPK